MRRAWYWESLVALALPLLDDYENVWRGVIFGLMEATAPKEVADLIAAAFEAEGHMRSGSLIQVAGGRNRSRSSKKAGRRRRRNASIHKEPPWPWEGC